MTVPPITPRPDILATTLAAHGGRRALQDGGSVRHDFSVCLNAYGTSSIVRDAILAAAVDEYPDPHALAPRAAAATRWNRSVPEILFAAGAAELIQLVCFAYLRPHDAVVIVTPAFGEYERAARLCGAHPHWVEAMTPAGVEVDLVTPLCDTLRRVRPRLAFVCTPSNPAGRCLTRDMLITIADVCAAQGTMLVLDQAYDAFTEAPLGTPALPGHPAVLHLRSITKDHALAGVRAAFATGPAEIINALSRAQIPWSTSAAAQSAGVAAMSNEAHEHVLRTTALLRQSAQDLADAIRHMGYTVRPSATHFFLIDVRDATTCRDALVRQSNIFVRDCSSFGLPSWIRVAARTPAENHALLEALQRWSSTAMSPSISDSRPTHV